MDHLMNLFREKNVFDTYISQKHISVHWKISNQLLELLDMHPAQFVRFLNCKASPNFNSLQKASLIHLILVHSGQYYSLFEKLTLKMKSSDTWFNSQVLSPYQNYLRKIIHSCDMYEKLRTVNLGWNFENSHKSDYHCKMKMRENPKQYFNLELVCYCVNLINELLLILGKVPNLGRYYKREDRKQIDSFVKIASFECVLLYFPLKFILNQILQNHQKYITHSSQQQLLKEIITVNMQKINENIKLLLLNKYFQLIEKGIRTSLFELDSLGEQSIHYVESVLGVKCREVSKRDNQRKFMSKLIFKAGSFDENLFEESVNMMNSCVYSQNCENFYDKENDPIGENKPSKLQENKRTNDQQHSFDEEIVCVTLVE